MNSALLERQIHYFKGGCVASSGPRKQRNFFKVLPREPSTDLTQIAIAACSLEEPNRLRSLTVRRTFLIQ
jgi:hypothetical protein